MKFISKILNVRKLIVRLWLSLWVVLAICLVCKFCFHMWYPIVVENEHFIKVCDFIDNNKYIKHIIYLSFYILNLNLIYLICTHSKFYHNIREPIIVNLLAVGNYFIKNTSNIMGFILELLVLVVLPIIVNLLTIKGNGKLKLLKGVIFPIAMNILIMVWQLLILMVRDIDLVLTNEHALVTLVMQIDYYIFLIITYLGVQIMGTIGAWFWSKNITQLKAFREEELKKEKPDMETVKQIEARIKELEEKESK